VSSDAGNSTPRFPTTHWSEIARAGDLDPQIKRQAMGRLLNAYLPALRQHLIVRKRIAADRVDDLVQGFVCDQVVADDLIAKADKERGRFRAFVVVALERYVSSVYRHDNAQKRRPDQPILNIDETLPPPGSHTAADPFDVAWARQVVERAIAQMRSQCKGRREQLWNVFESCALAPLLDGASAPPLSDLASRLGFASPQQVSNTLITAKRMFARVLRKVVGEYSRDDEAVEDELRDLLAILSRAGPSSGANAEF
jgi:RNA polymerase sigma-70 factor (ECF subfamily)